MSIYLTGAEVKTFCELGLSVSKALGSVFYVNFSGLKIDYKPTAWPNGVQNVYLYSPADVFCEGAVTPIDPAGSYHAVIDLFTLQMLKVVNAYLPMFGLSPIYPKDASGNEIDLNDPTAVMNSSIDCDPAEGFQELKEWMALFYFLNDPAIFPTDSIPDGVYKLPGGSIMGRINIVP